MGYKIITKLKTELHEKSKSAKKHFEQEVSLSALADSVGEPASGFDQFGKRRALIAPQQGSNHVDRGCLSGAVGGLVVSALRVGLRIDDLGLTGHLAGHGWLSLARCSDHRCSRHPRPCRLDRSG